jgi:hypothetical protein
VLFVAYSATLKVRSFVPQRQFHEPPFQSLAAMLDRVERTTTATLYATQGVSNAVKQAIQEEADPHIVAGALVDGITVTLLAGIAPERRRSVANDLLILLYRRLDSLNMFDDAETDG